MRKILILVWIIALCIPVFAEGGNNETTAPKGIVKGKIIDSKSKQPLEYATIALKRSSDDQVIDGTITDANGFFRMKNVENGEYYLEVTFIGYKPQKINQIVINDAKKNHSAGEIFVSPASEEIDEAVVVADRPTMSYKIDKKVINVSQQHTSASETAVEILENIPSVTVDVEGNVSLRGSTSFTVLIDNKPTVLDASDALSQIPASSIENIEVITNPSAKFNPEGAAGIINIITKKNRLEGISGVVNANIGSQGRYGGDFLFNIRKDRFNFFVGADYNMRGRDGNRTMESWTLDTANVKHFNNSEGEFERGRTSVSGRAGFDFTINPKNSLNFDINIGDWNMGGESETDFSTYTEPATSINNYASFEESTRGGLYYKTNLNYTHNFLKKGHMFTGLINYSSRDFSEESTNKLYSTAGVIQSGQKSFEDGPNSHFKLKLDYTLPLRIKDKFEAGYHLDLDQNDSDTRMEEYDPLSGNFIGLPQFSHDVSYNKNIHAIYSIYSGEVNNFGYQAGLRGEYTYRNIALNDTGEEEIIDRWDFFPTLHLSYNMPKNQQMMASYTRRIRRPRGWDLEPFFTWMDAFNVRQGNPGLKPQYIDSYELSYLNKFGRNSFSADVYYRVTHDKIERIRNKFEDQDGVFVHTSENVGQDYSLGIELMLGLDLTRWWHVDLMGNLYDYKVEGELEGQDFSESSFNWNSRLNSSFKLSKTTRIQLNAMYNSATVSSQGEQSDFLMANLAVKQTFFKNKLSATLSARDILRTMSHSSVSEGELFYLSSEFEPLWPMVTLTLSYKINNYRPSRKRREAEEDFSEGDGF